MPEADASQQLDARAMTAAVSVYYQARRRKLLQNLSPRQAAAIRSVPYLLHTHTEGLPGYRDTSLIPRGVAMMSADEMVEGLWGELFKEPKPRTDGGTADIESVGLIGEAGTIGQGLESTFQFWVIVGSAVSEQGRVALDTKCTQVAEWLRKQHKLYVSFAVVTAEDLRQNDFRHLTNGPVARHAANVVRDRFYAEFFPLAGKMPLAHLVPPAGRGPTYAQVRTMCEAGQWGNLSIAVDLGEPVEVRFVDLIHDVLTALEESSHRPADLVLPLAVSMVRLRSRMKEHFADLVKTAFLQNPEEADPFEIAFDLIEQGFADVDPLNRFYLREVYYLKTGAALSRYGGTEPPGGSRDARAMRRVKTWGWSPMVLMTLDSVTLWNYKQLVNFYRTLVRFVAFTRDELATALAKLAGETSSVAPALARISGDVSAYFRQLPSKIVPVTPYSTRHYDGSVFRLDQRVSVRGVATWSVKAEVPSGRALDSAKTELELADGRSLIALLIWLNQSGILTLGSQISARGPDKDISQSWTRELVQACDKLSKSLKRTAKADVAAVGRARRSATGYLLAANMSQSVSSISTRTAKVMTKSTGSTTTVLSEAIVFDYEGSGSAALKDFTIAWMNGAGETFAHELRYDHHALARTFAMMIPNLRYDEDSRQLNVDVIVPPTAEGMNLRMALQVTLFELAKFFAKESKYLRRYLTRQRGVCYIFDREPGDGPVKLIICRTVQEMLTRLEDTRGMPARVAVDKQVTGLERLRDLFSHAKPGEVNLYFFRETDPHQVHIIDEYGAFFSERFGADGAAGFVGETHEFIKRYAARRGVPVGVYDMSRRRGRVSDYAIVNAEYPSEVLARRTSTFSLAVADDPQTPGNVRVELGSSATSTPLSRDLIAKLSMAARKAGGVSVLEVPKSLPLVTARQTSLDGAAAAMRAARYFKAALLGDGKQFTA